MKSFHIWDFPDDIYILLNSGAKENLFINLYLKFGNRERLAKFLNLDPTTVKEYHIGLSGKNGRTWVQYIPTKFFKKVKFHLTKDLIKEIENSVLAYRPRAGTPIEKPILPIKESPELYRIVGHILGDGSATKRKVPYYANTCKELREEFIRDLQIFGDVRTSNRVLTVPIVTFPKAITKVLSYCLDMPFAVKESLPKNIFSAPQNCKSALLRALFDDEGSSSAQVTIAMINKKIVEDTKALLFEFGILSSGIHVTKNNSGSNFYHLSILAKSNKDFLDKIGFSHPKKLSILIAQVKKRYRKNRTREISEIENLILNYLRQVKRARTIDIANNIQLGLGHTLFHLKRIKKEGKIKNTIEENKYYRWSI